MRAWLLAVLLAVGLADPSRADQKDPRLEPLFARLKTASTEAEARPVEARIWEIWGEIDEAESRALFARGVAAMSQGDGRTAHAAFDLLVAREPEFAEGWNKRATLLYLEGDDGASVADIRRTLALEPRHFGALSGLALIYSRTQRPVDALHCLEAALAIYPNLPGGRERLQELKREAAGDPT
ncbi:MAG: tetratricopeptide repeat protein [Geminicoccaceae bacterium]